MDASDEVHVDKPEVDSGVGDQPGSEVSSTTCEIFVTTLQYILMTTAVSPKCRVYEEIITQAKSFFKKYDVDIVGKMATIWYVGIGTVVVCRERRAGGTPVSPVSVLQLAAAAQLPANVVCRILHNEG